MDLIDCRQDGRVVRPIPVIARPWGVRMALSPSLQWLQPDRKPVSSSANRVRSMSGMICGRQGTPHWRTSRPWHPRDASSSLLPVSSRTGSGPGGSLSTRCGPPVHTDYVSPTCNLRPWRQSTRPGILVARLDWSPPDRGLRDAGHRTSPVTIPIRSHACRRGPTG